MKKAFCLLFAMVLAFGLLSNVNPNVANASTGPQLHGVLADYAGAIRETRADGIPHVDTPALIQKLKELHVSTYYYLVWREPTDWKDFKTEFLPAAEKAGINVVVYLVPPSESRGSLKSYPYTTDYVSWAKAIAQLSLQYHNLIGWAIDDFGQNLNYFTPEYMAKMKAASDAINPNLKFTPQMYIPALTKEFLQTRSQYINGVIIAYRDSPFRNTEVNSSEQGKINQANALLSSYHLPLYWMIYTSKLSFTPANPTVAYVRKTAQIALQNMKAGNLAGVITYSLYKDNVPELYDKKAYSGNGYLSFFVPAGVATSPGDYVSASQTINPNKSGPYNLTFQTMDEGPNAMGYHEKQVLIDGKVVWQQDVAQNTSDRQWQKVKLDLTPYLIGKKSATLTLRLFENKGVGNYWDNVGFDDLQSTGFTVANGGFESLNGWTITNNYHGLIGKILIFNPNRRVEAFNAIETAYTSYTLYKEIYNTNIQSSLKQSLLVKVNHSLNYYFAGQYKDAMNQLNDLQNEIQAQSGKSIPKNDANQWLTLIDQLNQLYKNHS